MPKPYEAKTLEEFGGLRISGGTTPAHSTYSNADLKDNEASILTNFVFNDTGGLSKRHSVQTMNSAIVPTLASPTGALTAPANVRPLGIQRLSSAVNDKLYFTNVAKTNLWSTELTNCVNGTTKIIRGTQDEQLSGVEWMINASTPASPFQVLFCSNNSPLMSISAAGGPAGIHSATGVRATHMSLFKGRVFAINEIATVAGDESKLYYSDVGAYTTFGANSFNVVGASQGDYMVSTIVFNDTLIIFKARSTWVLVADGDPASWSYRNLHPSIGCAGRGTPQIIGGMIYFMGNDGIYQTDGTSFNKISEPVDSLITYDTANPSIPLLRDAWYWNDKYILKYGVGTSLLVYDIPHEAWTQWEFTGGVNIAGAAAYIDVALPAFYMGDYVTNKVYRIADEPAGTGWLDNGATYKCTWLSKRQTWGDPVNYKRNYMFAMDVGHSNLTGNPQPKVTVTHKTDSNLTAPPYTLTSIAATSTEGASDLDELSRRELKLPGAGYGRAIETKIEYEGASAFEVYSVTWLNSKMDTVKKSN